MLTIDKAKKIMHEETPVIFMESEYIKINALIFRKQGKGYSASAELLDKNRNCIVIAPLEWVSESSSEKIELSYSYDIRRLANESKELWPAYSMNQEKKKAWQHTTDCTALLKKLLELDRILLKEMKDAREDD